LLGCFPRLLTDTIAISVEPVARMAQGEPRLVSKPVQQRPRAPLIRRIPRGEAPNAQ
jgi:hypothetical protein